MGIGKGIKFSQERIEQMSKARMGKPGHPHSIEQRKKISQSLMGKVQSVETRKKMSLAHIGRVGHIPSLETRKKMSDARKGVRPWNKIGENGITPLHEKARKSLEYKFWRKSVFGRDNYTCQKYGIKGGHLHAHHINNFSDHEELRTSIENGITLSKIAHKEFHKIYGKKNNTKEQLVAFLSEARCDKIINRTGLTF